jgi:hypothetical protein
VCAAGCSGPNNRRPTVAAGEIVALNNRGVGLMGQFDFDRAAEAFARASAAASDRLDLRVNLAIATLNRQRDGDAAQAQQLLEAILTIAPQHVRAHYALGLLLLNDGHAGDALPQFVFVAEHEPADAYAAYYTALCRFQQGDVAGALSSYEHALLLNPRLRSAAYGAFQARQRLGRPDAQSMLDLFRQLETNPQSETVEFKYTRMGPLAEAVTIDEPARQRIMRPPGPVFDTAPVPLLTGTAGTTAWRQADASHPPTMTMADIDGDGLIDLFIADTIDDRGSLHNAVLLNRGAEGFVLDVSHPLAAVPDVYAALWGDFDNDGLTDVYLCRRGSNQLWRQTEKGRWSNVSGPARAEGAGGTTIDGAMFDADHDGDLDLLLIKSDGASELLNNNGDGTFRPLGAQVGLAGDRRPSSGILLADLDSDRDTDIVVIKKSPPHDVLVNDRAWQYHRDKAFETFVETPMTAAVAGDLDANGRPELYTSGASGIERWTRSPAGPWEPTLVAGTSTMANASQLALADLDGDGRLDLVATASNGRWQAVAITQGGEATPIYAAEGPRVASWSLAMLDPARGPSIVAMPADGSGAPIRWKPGAGRFPFVSLTLSGRDRQSTQRRSNASGIGAQLAARAGSQWTALARYRAQSFGGQSLQPIAFGLSGSPQLDFVAITWSDGVLQTELALAPGPVRQIDETQRQLSSCPVLFAFDGRHFAFVTDLLGVGGIGTPTSPGIYEPPHPSENVLLPEGLLAVRDGTYQLKITEPMEEVAYIDAARLVAYDLPPGWEMILDERKAISAPEATGEPRFFRDERVPVQVTDEGGQDVTRAVVTADLVAAPPGRLDPRYIGRTEARELTLRFDRALNDATGDAMLVADGWIEYPYAQTLFAAWQARVPYQAPTIEARGDNRQWHVLRREFGYPAGMPRRMSVPLGRLPHAAMELRLRTTQEIYWDRLAVAYAAATPGMDVHSLPLASARLAYTGFPRRQLHASRRPSYDYDERVPLADTRHARGFYTVPGSVTELVAAQDGALAVFGPGEELQLTFSATLPPLKAGWTRRLVLEARGWCKDMDLYTKDGETVAPLPGTRGPVAAALQRRYTTRYESGR